MWYERIWKLMLYNERIKSLDWSRCGGCVILLCADEGLLLLLLRATWPAFLLSSAPAWWHWTGCHLSGPTLQGCPSMVGEDNTEIEMDSQEAIPSSFTSWFTKPDIMLQHLWDWSSSSQQPGAWWKSCFCRHTLTMIMVGPWRQCPSHQSSWHDWENSIYPGAYHWWPSSLPPEM